MSTTTKFLLIAGNVVDGLTFSGPFDTTEDASDYADTMRIDEWTVTTLVRAECDDEGNWISDTD